MKKVFVCALVLVISNVTHACQGPTSPTTPTKDGQEQFVPTLTWQETWALAAALTEQERLAAFAETTSAAATAVVMALAATPGTPIGVPYRDFLPGKPAHAALTDLGNAYKELEQFDDALRC